MSHYKANGELKKTAPDYFTITPDVDNVTKFVLDALQPAVLKDDKFVVLCLWVREAFDVHNGATVHVQKEYCNDERNEKVQIELVVLDV